MKKIILALFIMCAFVPLARATDWSKYDSGFVSIRLQGYHTQPGYIAFYDETGAIAGYLYAHSNGSLYFAKANSTSTNYTNLTVEKLGTNGGEGKITASASTI